VTLTAEDVNSASSATRVGTSDLKKVKRSRSSRRIRSLPVAGTWPDFLTFYATPTTGAGWIVPKNYTEKIGSEKFKEQPIGLGPIAS
jgi:hypothetical protein